MRKIVGAIRHPGHRLRDHAGQVDPPYFAILFAVVVLVAIAVFSFGGVVGKRVVHGQVGTRTPGLLSTRSRP